VYRTESSVKYKNLLQGGWPDNTQKPVWKNVLRLFLKGVIDGSEQTSAGNVLSATGPTKENACSPTMVQTRGT